jgi:AraC family transcriptional regulator of adaptative response/methylated-DNA-[protein]-cysteine methyltransferase
MKFRESKPVASAPFQGREAELFQALVDRNPAYDGIVLYGIVTTGIFCRSICSARKPKPANVRFFANPKAAMDAGFRPCKLCHPLEVSIGADQMPAPFRNLLDALAKNPSLRFHDADLRGLGLDPGTVRRFFKRKYAMTFHAFARTTRLAHAFDAIQCGVSVTDAAFASGYESLSGFGDAAKSHTGRSPREAGTSAFWLSRLETPIGAMVAGIHGGRLCLLEFADRRALESEIMDLEKRFATAARPGRSPVHDEVQQQLSAYFQGKLMVFSLDLEYPGSDFQQAVWESLLAIPYGQTRSYGEQAASIGRTKAVRAVARANGQNRLAIVVPCHRVVGADGSLTGYAGGLDRKRFLLDLESSVSGSSICASSG